MYGVANKLYKLFFIKSLFKNYYFYNFFYIFSLAFDAGLGIKESINLSCDMVKLDESQEGLNKIKSLLSNGCELTTAFNVSELFSSDTVAHISAGEKSGKLAESANVVAQDYQNSLNMQIDILLKTLEPFLMCVVGLLVVITLIRFYITYYSKLFSWL